MADMLPDKRLNAYRDDLAAAELEGIVHAARFVAGERRQVIRSSIAVRDRPIGQDGFSTEALYGEVVRVFEEIDGWAWIQLERDGYVGYVPAEALGRDVHPTTHRVAALGTFVYPAPDIKAAPLMHLSLNCAIAVAQTGERFARLESGGFVMSRHIREHGRFAPDFVEIAERLIGTPYLWGGCTRIGLDCSGLVQMSLMAAGIDAPRDSDMQQAQLGEAVAIDADLAILDDGLRRGDLVFWRGHVGVMADDMMLIHANAFHMSTVTEPVREAAQRIARSGSPVTAVRRMGRR